MRLRIYVLGLLFALAAASDSTAVCLQLPHVDFPGNASGAALDIGPPLIVTESAIHCLLAVATHVDPSSPSTSPEDCCAQCTARGTEVCAAAVLCCEWPQNTHYVCYFKTLAQTKLPAITTKNTTLCWPPKSPASKDGLIVAVITGDGYFFLGTCHRVQISATLSSAAHATISRGRPAASVPYYHHDAISTSSESSLVCEGPH